jgi:hypothetical protein
MDRMNGIEILNESNLDGWKEIFECWESEIQRSVHLTSGYDAPFVHSEHGNTHLFGVSASMAGFVTFREVVGKRNGNPARLDLCLISEKYLDIVEAKWLEFNLSDSFPKKRISDQVKGACNDAKIYTNTEKLFRNEGNKKIIRRTGITFITPHFQEDKSFSHDVIVSTVENIRQNIKSDILAWSFPTATREMHYWQRVYPGVIAVATSVK